jgi:2',3'-cyclic-nucleotide 2'-phosphodiesterase (5'-nucleotidase family)
MRLTLLQLNDSHGYLKRHTELYRRGGQEVYRRAGGYARIATLFNHVRNTQPDGVVALDNGDTIHGTYPAVQSEGEALIPILNALGFDAMTAHWEFAYGPARFKRIAKKLNYPVLACNCYYRKTDQLVFAPFSIVKRAGLRIGIIGIAAVVVDKVMPPRFSEGLYFTLGIAELPFFIRELRLTEGVDLIVVLSHLGYPQELRLASEIDGIDVLLSGHTHNRLYAPAVVNETIIMQSGCHGSFIGRLDLSVKNGRVARFQHELLSVDDAIQPDPAVADLVNKAMDPHRELLATEVGRTNTALNRNRIMEATMDNLLLQSLEEASDADVTFSNGWRYGAPVAPGSITVNDLWNIIPVNPPLTVCELKGRELWEMMEENLEHTFSRDPYQQMGGYVKRCWGLNVYFKIENPPGKRIQEFFVGDKPLDPSKTYTACFVTTQGVPAHYGVNRHNLKIKAIDALTQHIEAHSPVSAELRGTIVPI